LKITIKLMKIIIKKKRKKTKRKEKGKIIKINLIKVFLKRY